MGNSNGDTVSYPSSGKVTSLDPAPASRHYICILPSMSGWLLVMSYVQHSSANAKSLDMKVSLAKVRMDRRDYGAEIPGLSWACCEQELCVNHGRESGYPGQGHRRCPLHLYMVA